MLVPIIERMFLFNGREAAKDESLIHVHRLCVLFLRHIAMAHLQSLLVLRVAWELISPKFLHFSCCL